MIAFQEAWSPVTVQELKVVQVPVSVLFSPARLAAAAMAHQNLRRKDPSSRPSGPAQRSYQVCTSHRETLEQPT